MTPSPHLSLVHGATEPPLFRLTLGQLVDQQALRYGSRDAVAVRWSGTRITFQGLSRRTKDLAKGLLAMGVRRGDRVAIFCGDDERFIELFFAVGRIGAVLVILNKTYTVPECARALESTGRWSSPLYLSVQSGSVTVLLSRPFADQMVTSRALHALCV